MRKWELLIGVGIVLGLISGLYGYESVKGKDAGMKEGMESVTENRMSVPPPLDAPLPGTIETATFALG